MLSAYIPASLLSGTITFPLTFTLGVDDALMLRDSSTGAFTTFTIPSTAPYADMAELVTALNTLFGTANFVAVVFSATELALQTKTMGAATYIGVHTVAGGSTANTPLALPVGGANFTVPSAAAYILAVSPPLGPLDVSSTLIRTTLGAGLTDVQVAAAADAIAPQFVETDVAIKSFEVGNLAQYLSATYTPDPNRIPAMALGPAIAVVQDDGVSAFVAPVPLLTSGTVIAGVVTLGGVGLASAGSPNAEVQATTVRFLKIDSNESLKSLPQGVIIAAGGVVSSTGIVIPATLVPAEVVAGRKVQVIYTSLASNVYTLT
jgi:hypothetical protein